MIDQLPHVPLRARGRRRPLVGCYTVNQLAHNCGCTCEIIDDRGIRHSARLRHGPPDATVVFGRLSPDRTAEIRTCADCGTEITTESRSGRDDHRVDREPGVPNDFVGVTCSMSAC